GVGDRQPRTLASVERDVGVAGGREIADLRGGPVFVVDGDRALGAPIQKLGHGPRICMAVDTFEDEPRAVGGAECALERLDDGARILPRGVAVKVEYEEEDEVIGLGADSTPAIFA